MSAHSSHRNYYHHHIRLNYPASAWQRLHAVIAIPLLAVILVVILFKYFVVSQSLPSHPLSLSYLAGGLLATLLRLLVAYFWALTVSIPLVLLVQKNTYLERLLLPLFDIIQSVPVLAFFPVVILLFIRYNLLNGAAIFVIFLSMLWNIVFNVVGGLKVIPTEIKSAAQVFNIRGFAFIRKILLPAVFPYIVIGSLLAWAQGWNIIIVAEVLHTYIPGGTHNQDLFGIGSILVNAASGGQQIVFVAAIISIVLAIGLMNYFIWQKLLRYAELYRFE